MMTFNRTKSPLTKTNSVGPDRFTFYEGSPVNPSDFDKPLLVKFQGTFVNRTGNYGRVRDLKS